MPFLPQPFYDCYKIQDNSADFLRVRSSTLSRLKKQLQDKILYFASKVCFVYVNLSTADKTIEQFTFILKHIDELEKFYYLLQDDLSRQLLIDLLKYRILGRRHVKLPINNKTYWDKLAFTKKNLLKKRHTILSGGWDIDLYELQKFNSLRV